MASTNSLISAFPLPKGSRSSVFKITNTERKRILNKIRTKWKTRIRSSFSLEGDLVGESNRVIEWAELSEDYSRKKSLRFGNAGILTRGIPTLGKRYQEGINIKPSTFSITIEYPALRGTGSIPTATAAVHQLGTPNMPKRSLTSAGFIRDARAEIVKHFSNKASKN